MITVRGLALDLGSTVGWAADDPTGADRPLAGIWSCSHDGQNLGESFGYLEQYLVMAVHRLRPAYISKEAAVAVRWGKTNADASRILLGMAGIVELVAWRLHLPCYDVNIGSARKYLTGNSRAGKSDVWDRCRLNGWPADDLNATDALAVLAYSRSCFGVEQILDKALACAGSPKASGAA